jgi:aminodeoxychorismate synthase component I
VEVVSWGWTPDGHFDERLALQRAEALEERLRHAEPILDDPPSLVDEHPLGGAHPFVGELRSSTTREQHSQKVRAILDAIGRGDIYQANLTVRFEADVEGDGVALFERLLRDNPAPHAAFVEADDATIISSSPERMLRAHGRALESRPIKGTARRSSDPTEDARLADALRASTKDRAELLMITDLVRNDLGKVCDYGTVVVPKIWELESFPHLHHLVSTVRGRLRADADVFDALGALFPFGSITGAPKRRAMEILRDLEDRRRDVYTGTVGWVGFDRSADFNVAIRTGHLSNGVFSFGAGGGIVADSNPDDEWAELLLKAKAIGLALGAGETDSVFSRSRVP